MDRGFICLAGRIDWGTGELLPDRQFPLKHAVQSTCSKRPSLTMVLLGINTDQKSQFTSQECVEVVWEEGTKLSMDGCHQSG